MLGSDQGFPTCTVQARLPDLHMIFMFYKLKVSVPFPTTCLVLSLLEASGGLENLNVLVDIKTYICCIELTL